MRGEVLGLATGAVALVGAATTLAVLASVYRRAGCLMRTLVIGIAIGLVWKASIAFSTPRWIDGGDALIVAGITVVYLRRLWRDRARGTDGGDSLDAMAERDRR